MIIRKHHEQEGHCGTSHVLNAIGRKYWIARGRAAVGRLLLSCINCPFWNAGRETQWMGNLQECRIAAGELLFTATGVDIMGPKNVKQGFTVSDVRVSM